MRRLFGLRAATALGVLQLSGLAHAGVIWDNGGPAVSNPGASLMSDTIQADDFQLSALTSLTSITFWSLEASPADYTGSIFWQVVGDNSGSPNGSNVIGSGLVTPTRTAAGTVLGFNQFQNDFAITLNNVAAGTYWLELHNGPLSTTDFTDFYWSYADIGGSNSGSNRGMENGLAPATGWTVNDNEHAFNVSGDALTSATPEPGTALISFAAVGALAFLRARQS